MDMNESFDAYVSQLQYLIDTSKKTVAFCGAGISTESGIPDFRSQDGLYNQKYDVPPEEILSHTYFFEHTKEFYEFYRDKMIVQGKKPNPAHLKLAELESAGKLSSVITQNIDTLHRDAGSKNVLDLHGTVSSYHCWTCRKKYDLDFVLKTEGIPHCSCGGILKPDVVLYEEMLDDDICGRALEEISSADVLIVIGTSLTVYPAAGFISYYRGDKLVLINRDPTPYDSAVNYLFRGNAGEILGRIKV